MTKEKRKQVAENLKAKMDEADRRGDAVIRQQAAEELRVLLPKSQWKRHGV